MSDKKKKLSGARNRKIKSEREIELKKNMGSLKNFVSRLDPSLEENLTFNSLLPLTSNFQNNEESFDLDKHISQDSPPVLPLSPNKLNIDCQESKELVNSDILLDSNMISEDVLNDLALWPDVLSDRQRMLLVLRGPIQEKENCYPLNSSKRSFSNLYFSRRMTNNENVLRSWLLYSKSSDAVFCFYCKLFQPNLSALSKRQGYNDWQHLSETLDRHEKSKGHLKAVKSHICLKTGVLNKKTVDYVLQCEIEREKNRWIAVLKRLVNIVLFLARQCLGFRGKFQQLYKSDNGNFLKMVEFCSNFDQVLAEHLALVQKSDKRLVHYLGHNIQNEIIFFLGERIKKTIVSELKKSKYFSIILDCTPDVSHVEQISVIARYVLLNLNNNSFEIKEHFLGFFPILDTTGQGLTQFLFDFLDKNEIDIQDMRGQGYDNGSNMKGKHVGLQKRILDINPRAFYIPCAAHSLNLVVNDAARGSLEIVNFFSVVQELYVFFSASTSRWQILAQELPTLTLKPLSNTRWESRVEAVKALRFNLGKVYDALFIIFSDESKDLESKNLACSLLKKIQNFKFICSLIIWFEILSNINIVSKALQKSDVVLSEAVQMLHRLEIRLQETRNETSFESFIEKAKILAEEVEATVEFNIIGRPRARRTFSNLEVEGESKIDAKIHFKDKFYYYLLDTAILKLNERFLLLNQSNEIFLFLSKLQDWKELDLDSKNAYCINLEQKLSYSGSSDVNSVELLNEIEMLPMFISDSTSPMDILNYLLKNSLISVLPNLSIALRIYLTLPVTVSQSERSFSKLKRIKNYLRSTLTESRLTNLSLISIEHDVKFEIEDIIKDFADAKARKVNFK